MLLLLLCVHIHTPVLLEYAAAIQASRSADPATGEAGGNRLNGCSVQSGARSGLTSSAEGQAAPRVWTPTENAKRETFSCCGVCQPSELFHVAVIGASVGYDQLSP